MSCQILVIIVLYNSFVHFGFRFMVYEFKKIYLFFNSIKAKFLVIDRKHFFNLVVMFLSI